MKKSLVLLLCLYFGILNLQAQNQNELNLYYKTDHWKLSSENKKELKNFCRNADTSAFTITVSGFTDSIGSVEYNIGLSQKRAEEVRKWFIKNGYAIGKINVYALGESQAIKSNHDLQLDRRTDISLTQPRDLNFVKNTPKVPNTTIYDLYKLLVLEPETFIIDNSRDTMIVCKKGSMVFIRARSFNLPENCNNNMMRITVKEVLEMGEMIAENTDTRSDSDLLETAGMMDIHAYTCEKEVQLNANSRLVIFFPEKMNPGVMGTYLAKRDSAYDLNWKLNESDGIADFIPARFWNGDGNINCLLKRKPHHFIFYGMYQWVINGFQKYNDNILDHTDVQNTYAVQTYLGFQGVNINNQNAINNVLKKYGFVNTNPRQSEINHLLYGYNQTPIINQANKKLNHVLFSSKSSGWINSDQLYTAKGKTTLDLPINADSMTDVKLIFIDNKIAIGAVPNNEGKFSFPGIPGDKKAIMIGLRYEKGIPYTASKEIITGKTEDLSLKFEQISLKDLKKKLQEDYKFKF